MIVRSGKNKESQKVSNLVRKVLKNYSSFLMKDILVFTRLMRFMGITKIKLLTGQLFIQNF
ncbi:MAG: hypothetical protein EBY80_11420 [Actinobacteria bacterium]|nr:hypothetical protein [Actinomycetota bacterium]